MSSKKVQVDVQYLHNVKMLLDELEEMELNVTAKACCDVLRASTMAKFEAMERRNAFTAYKQTEIGTEAREQHRNAYLDLVGTPKDWRTTEEKSYEDM